MVDITSPTGILKGVTLLSSERTLFIVDEFDRASRGTNLAFSDLIKSISDTAHAKATVMLVGVSDTLESLLENHPSIERNVSQIHLDLMSIPEIKEIIQNGEKHAGVNYSPEVKNKISEFSLGMPYYVHVLALKSALFSLKHDRNHVNMSDFKKAVSEAHQEADHSIRRAYQVAVTSPRKTTFPDVLFAAARAECDDFGFFRLSDMAKVEMDDGGRRLKPQALQYPLSKLIAPERGKILIREGEKKRYRYRFSNPMMKQYILMLQAADRGLI